jgi:CheY-like chemotaxis protein
MDIEMPTMDGLTCARRIRALEESGEIKGHVPLLAVSANARSEQVRLALEAGMDDSIAKPFRIPEVLAKIELLAWRPE